MKKSKALFIFLSVSLFVFALFAAEVHARRGGGRGGGRSISRGGGRSAGRSMRRSPSRNFSRSGVASRGSFSSRPRTRPTRPSSGSRIGGQGRPSGIKNRPGTGQRPSAGIQGRPSNLQGRPAAGLQGRPSQGRRPGSGDRPRDRLVDRRDRAAPGESRRQQVQDKIKDRQEDRQEFIKDRLEDRQDFVEDVLDDRWDSCWNCYHYPHDHFVTGVVVGGAVVGTAAAVAGSTTTVVTTLPCTATSIVVNGVTYFSCGTTWYRRSYSGSQVTYIIVDPPPGY